MSVSINTNRKSHMGFRLVPKSVKISGQLNDLEWCNDRRPVLSQQQLSLWY